ncbi:ERCC4 domain-containing protein [Ditylenchus destructor]|uniref:DNA repair endonuclease XPF n=1 Tax=Ditylenchus destructor TaxID=166010 RepID=A0AAD4R7M7_9BILA|nr:ERCC4 domain-containing protein [Ditylenchus destructor]
MLPEDPLTDHYSKQSEVGTKQSEGGLDADSSEDGTKKSNEEESDERNVNPEGIPESETNSNVTENLEELNSSINADGVDLSTLKSMLVFLSLGNRYNLLNCLQDLRPSHIVLYNIDIVSTRIIETFKAHHQELPMEMYALMYTDTTEEERYLVSINREQNAFETLIKEQGVLMVPNEYDVSRDSTSQLRKLTLRRDSRFNPPTETEIQPTVVVDMREFNSELPTVLYCRGIDVYPATLEVGDYVLSDEICVERKALDDLAQSLHNGRVFKQTEQMLRHYSKSILLIESSEKFRQRKVNGGPFQGELSRRSRETRLLLTVLIRTHPQLSLVWTFSPSHSAELFEEVKLDQSNPDVDIAVSIKSDDLAINRDVADDTLLGSAENENEIPTVNALFASKSKSLRLNSVLKRQLSNLPGLLGGDEEHLMRNCILLDTMQSTSQRGGEEAEESRSDASDSVMNVARLVQSSKDVLSKVLSNEKHAETLFEFFQTDFRLLPT